MGVFFKTEIKVHAFIGAAKYHFNRKPKYVEQ